MNKDLHVCIITTAHFTDDTRVYQKIAMSFSREGYRITWVGPSNSLSDQSTQKQYNIQYILTEPIKSRIDRIKSCNRIKKLAVQVPGIDVYYAPDPDSAELAIKLAGNSNKKVIFDIHELFHGVLLDRWFMGMCPKFVKYYVKERIKNICSLCDLVVVVNESILNAYITDKNMAMIIRSCAPSWFADGPPAHVCNSDRKVFRLMHGKMHRLRGTINVIEAMKRAAIVDSSIKVIMFTDENPEDDLEARNVLSASHLALNDKLLEIRKSIPLAQMPSVMQTCDAGLIAYGKGLGVDGLPNRLFEYMAVGLPVIAPSYASEIARIVESEKIGLLADFEDPISIADAILHLRRNPELCIKMGRRSRDAFLNRYNWDVEVRPLIERINSWFKD